MPSLKGLAHPYGRAEVTCACLRKQIPVSRNLQSLSFEDLKVSPSSQLLPSDNTVIASQVEVGVEGTKESV